MQLQSFRKHQYQHRKRFLNAQNFLVTDGEEFDGFRMTL
jgi:hypothetical protein